MRAPLRDQPRVCVVEFHGNLKHNQQSGFCFGVLSSELPALTAL